MGLVTPILEGFKVTSVHATDTDSLIWRYADNIYILLHIAKSGLNMKTPSRQYPDDALIHRGTKFEDIFNISNGDKPHPGAQRRVQRRCEEIGHIPQPVQPLGETPAAAELSPCCRGDAGLLNLLTGLPKHQSCRWTTAPSRSSSANAMVEQASRPRSDGGYVGRHLGTTKPSPLPVNFNLIRKIVLEKSMPRSRCNKRTCSCFRVAC